MLGRKLSQKGKVGREGLNGDVTSGRLAGGKGGGTWSQPVFRLEQEQEEEEKREREGAGRGSVWE